MRADIEIHGTRVGTVTEPIKGCSDSGSPDGHIKLDRRDVTRYGDIIKMVEWVKDYANKIDDGLKDGTSSCRDAKSLLQAAGLLMSLSMLDTPMFTKKDVAYYETPDKKGWVYCPKCGKKLFNAGKQGFALNIDVFCKQCRAAVTISAWKKASAPVSKFDPNEYLW